VVPDPEAQVEFLIKVQRILSEGAFTATYKFALLVSLADLAVERADDTTDVLPLDVIDIAEKFVELYWRQVLPWIPRDGGSHQRRLHQATGGEAAILNRIAKAHETFQGSFVRLRQHRPEWLKLLREVGRIIAVMPLWKLQTVGRQRLDFLYPNVGRGGRIQLRGEAVYCLRKFYDLVTDLAQNAWVRFMRGLALNRPLLGEALDLREFLFGCDRNSLAVVCEALWPIQEGRCFYCDGRIRGKGAVDHFIPWSRYPLDFGHNYVLADAGCNGNKGDRLAFHGHLRRWCERNEQPDLAAVFAKRALLHDLDLTRRVAVWAYSQAERTNANVWQEGRDGLVALDSAWRHLPGLGQLGGALV
jgi:hypothetical protein